MTAALVRQNAFDALLEKIEEDKHIKDALFEKHDGYRTIVKRIATVYYWLRITHGMPRWDLSLDQYKEGEQKLRAVALKGSRRPGNRIRKSFGHKGRQWPSMRTMWQKYLSRGHFDRIQAPLAGWSGQNWNDLAHPFGKNWNSFSTKTILAGKESDYNLFAVPPNIEMLAAELYYEYYKEFPDGYNEREQYALAELRKLHEERTSLVIEMTPPPPAQISHEAWKASIEEAIEETRKKFYS